MAPVLAGARRSARSAPITSVAVSRQAPRRPKPRSASS